MEISEYILNLVCYKLSTNQTLHIMRKNFTLILSLIVLFLGPLKAQIIFDPATFDPGSLPAGMSIITDTATGTKYLKAALDGWNTSITVPTVTILPGHTRFKVKVKYKEGGTNYNWDNVNTFLKLSTPGWTELKAAGAASDTAFKTFTIDGFVPGSEVGVFQFAGQERTNWSAIAEDTLIIGRITIENPNAIVDPAVADTSKLPDGWTVVYFGDTAFYKVYINGWNTSMGGFSFTVPENMASYKTVAKYKVAGTHGYTVDQINTFIKVTDWTSEFTIGAASSATFKKYARTIDPGFTVTALQLTGQERVNWSAVVGDTLWLSALVPDWVDSLKVTSEGDADTITTDLGTLQMHATLYPDNVTNTTVTWSLSDENLAEIDENGLLSALDNGVVTVTATLADGGFFDAMDITISNQTTGKIWIDTILITSQEEKDYIDTKGGFLRMDGEIVPANATLKTFKWSVDADTVATINQFGRLTAVGNGVVTVMATADDEGGKVGEYVITVTNQNLLDTLIVSSEGDVTAIDTKGGTLQLYVEYLPEDADITTYEWSMSPAGLATIDANNLLTAMGDGVLIVQALSQDGSGVKGKIALTLSNQIRVASIDVHGAGAITEIPIKGGTLQMVAVLTPSNPSNPDITWSVDDPGVATIDANTGMLTAVMDGVVEVTATSLDPDGVSGSANISISGQAISVEDIAGKSLTLYPNPVSNRLYIKNAGSISSFEIINLDGKLMMKVQNNKDVISIDVSTLARGIYSVRAYQGDQVHVLKLVKE
jgi:uncharacterized protein YjdB